MQQCNRINQHHLFSGMSINVRQHHGWLTIEKRHGTELRPPAKHAPNNQPWQWPYLPVVNITGWIYFNCVETCLVRLADRKVWEDGTFKIMFDECRFGCQNHCDAAARRISPSILIALGWCRASTWPNGSRGPGKRLTFGTNLLWYGLGL